MSDTRNPFEEAMRTTGGEVDPFAPGAADPFGSVPPTKTTIPAESEPIPESTPANSGTALNLGSQAATNPFETPAAPPAGTPSDTPPAKPVIDLGSQSGTVLPFSAAIKDAASANGSAGSQLRLLSNEPEDSDEEKSDGEDPDEGESADVENPLAAAIAGLEKAENASIFAKAPIFEHGAVKEPIEDLNQTFEDLRVAKADDFPELEDAVRVSWDVTYGKIRKSVPTPKKTKIGEFKKQIESSKEFMDALKKEKNKSPDCIIKPRITAQSKGERVSSYKGVFTSLEAAENSGKVICIVPGSDGKVYEIRNEEAGKFITPSGECRELSEIRAGFTPALPLIPNSELRRIIGFFRSVMNNGCNYEAIANIYWDREREEYHVAVPKQHVTAVRAESELSDEYDSERFLHYMDVHSHNVMPARFSAQDDSDEKATRLYAVIGKLNNFIPEMSVRISNGGKYLLIDPSLAFESFGDYYPVEWNGQVTFDSRESDNDYFPETNNKMKFQCFLRSFGRKGSMCA